MHVCMCSYACMMHKYICTYIHIRFRKNMIEHVLEHGCASICSIICLIIIFASSPLSPNVDLCKYHVIFRLMGCLIIIAHFPHRSLIISGFSADLQLKASNLHHPLVAFSLTPRTLTSIRTAAWKSRIRENGAQYAATILQMPMHA